MKLCEWPLEDVGKVFKMTRVCCGTPRVNEHSTVNGVKMAQASQSSEINELDLHTTQKGNLILGNTFIQLQFDYSSLGVQGNLQKSAARVFQMSQIYR